MYLQLIFLALGYFPFNESIGGTFIFLVEQVKKNINPSDLNERWVKLFELLLGVFLTQHEANQHRACQTRMKSSRAGIKH